MKNFYRPEDEVVPGECSWCGVFTPNLYLYMTKWGSNPWGIGANQAVETGVFICDSESCQTLATLKEYK